MSEVRHRKLLPIHTSVDEPKSTSFPTSSRCHRAQDILIHAVLTSCAMAITLWICFSEGPIRSVSFVLPPPRPLKGVLSPNRILTQGERLIEGLIYGPESLAMETPQSKVIYAGLKTGHIVELVINEQGTMKVKRKFHPRLGDDGSICDGSYSMQLICGRPLGLRFSKRNNLSLLVADAYYGIYELNLVTGDSRFVVEVGAAIVNADAEPLRNVNDFDEREDGAIVLSEPSLKFADRDCTYAMAEHNNDGRLLLFDRGKEQLSLIADGLHYPNGVQMTDNGTCVLVAEMGMLRILKYCFQVSNSSSIVIVDNLPGYPDNIRMAQDGLLWVPMGQVRVEDESWITTRPWLRDLFAKLVPRCCFEVLIDSLTPKYGMVVIVDPANGSIVGSLHDPSGSTISSVSHVLEMDNGTLLLGGDTNTFILRVMHW